MNNKYIIGSGGGKAGAGAGHVAVEDPDSLRSTAYARVLDIISEGEIEGLVDGHRSIFFDSTPLQNPDGSYNFTGVQVETRNGTAGQTHIPLVSGVELETAVGIDVKAANPIERTITNPDVDWARITIGVPVLTKQDTSNGDLHGSSVSYKIEVSANGGPFTAANLTTRQQMFTGSTTPQATTGFTCAVKWSPNYTNAAGTWSGNRKKAVTATFRVEYRAGAGAWQTAGYFTRTADKNVVQLSLIGEDRKGNPVWSTVTFWPAEVTVGDVTVADLAPAVYELRVVVVSTTEVPHGGSSVTAGVATVPYATATIKGKTTSRYQRAHMVRLTDYGTAPWVIRVSRITPDSTSSALQNKTYWDALTQVVDEKLSYPHTALVALRVSAEQFQSIPARGYEIKGVKVKVPSNYNPLTRVYSGSWDGTFVVAWTDNPAWVWYDLATNTRYGVGDYVQPSMVDKWALYSIAQYCDELVPDGVGGLEPRYTCNLYLQTKQDAYKALTDIASIFRGMVYWSAGGLFVVADKPGAVAYQFTAANVIDGLFTYAGANQKTRHNAAYVTWNDPSDMYKQKVEYVADEAMIAKWGYLNSTDVTAVGCTSRAQARRVGEWILYTERFEAETVTFSTGLEGNIPRPGDIVQIADPLRAGERRGGRLNGATASTVTLDAPVTLVAGHTYSLSVVKADGSIETKTVTTGAGTTSSLAVSGTFSTVPATGTVWMLESDDLKFQLFKVLAVVEQEGGTQYQITAIAHYPQKYAYIEHDRDFQLPDTSNALDSFVAPPNVTGLQIAERLELVGQGLAVRLLVSWEALDARYGVAQYRVEWREQEGAWNRQYVSGTTAEITGVQDGALYDLRIVAVNPLGVETASPLVTQYTVQGKLAPPANVDGFVVARNGETLNFRWNYVTDIDVTGYELRAGTMWDAATPIGTTGSNSFTFTSPRGGTFMIKAVDSSGVYSKSATLVSVPDVAGLNVTVEYNEEAGGWGGAMTNIADISSARRLIWTDGGSWFDLASWNQEQLSGGLVPAGSGTWAELPETWEAYNEPWLFVFPAAATGGQYVTDILDIGYLAQSSVQVYPKVEILRSEPAQPWSTLNLPWASYTGPWAVQLPDIDTNISASYEVSTSDTGAAWSEYQKFTPGMYQFRYIRFRITLASYNGADYVPMLTKFRVSVDVPDRMLHFEDVTVPAAGVTLNFAPQFIDVRTVQVTLQNGAVGDKYTVSGKTNSQVTINVYDSAGAAKAGLVDVDVSGYGERL